MSGFGADGWRSGARLSRRAVLGSMGGLGLAGMTGLPSAPVSRVRPVAPAVLTDLQLAGQRVISSYPGLTPPQSLFNDITAGQTAGSSSSARTSPATPRSPG